MSESELDVLGEEAKREREAAKRRGDVTAYRYALSATGLLYAAEYEDRPAERRKMVAAAETLLEAVRLLLWGAPGIKAEAVN